MKKEDLFEAINDIDDREIEAAKRYRKPEAASRAAKRDRKALFTRWASVAACLVVLIAAVVLGRLQSGNGSSTSVPEGVKVVSAKPVEEVAPGMSVIDFLEGGKRMEWWGSYRDKMEESAGYQKEMGGYYSAMMQQLLEAEDENTVCSPLNIYLALSMLAEVTEGNTRAQILEQLEVPDIETLRTRVTAMEASNQVNTPTLKSLLANSLWLNDSVNYNSETLERLADLYRASTYSGRPGSSEMDQALREWIDSNTGGLLKEYTKDLELEPENVLTLVSTLYYRASWTDDFYKQATDRGIFHGAKGDTEVDMMHRSDSMNVYWTDDFAALGLYLRDSGAMYFYLPQEGADVNDLLSNPDIFKAMQYGEDENRYYRNVNLTVPKFKVSEKTDLKETLEELGITDAMDEKLADFSPLTTEEMLLSVSGAEHAATVEIDENGVIGAAYTEITTDGASMPPEETVDFVLDRPFLFVITARDGSLLFAGVVRNVE